ncbi:accessory Sec-dependent serine-rich glycoprotein adhesin, partial [Streptococcus mitis]|uniref:accessory Sec-dependent serine-rich glycoprotein adhesin n=1 Tax=Streptococcus mitis TaxID=28037 RepID=UPI0039C3B6C6
MFFRRQEGEYRETDRVTRFKLIKSGKHWLRASTSQFGLFKVLRGGVDAAQVTTEVIEEQSANTLTGLDILKGIAAAGTVLGGAVATQTTVYANDALEKTVESNQTLANTDTVTLGTVKDQEGAQADSLSVSVSQSQSLSEEASKNASKHLSESESQSVSTSTSASVSASTSASESASTSASESASTSSSQSQTGVTSELAKPATSETASNKETSVRKEDAANATADAPLSKVITESLASLQAVETRLSQITSTTSSLVDTTTTAAVATTVSAESNKKAQEDRKRLSKISATMGEYLAKSIGLPNTEAAVVKVNAAVTAIEEALKNPNADLTDVIKQATSAQNSIVNAVLRANNGKRDFLNGKAMKPGTQFRVRNTQTGSGAIGEQTENLANGESIKYLTSGENTNAKQRVETSVDLKAEPVYAANGKITKIIWTLMSNPRQTMGQTNVRHWIQIPSQVNMPTTIVDASYVDTATGSPRKDMTGLPKSTTPSDNMMPAEYNGMRRDSMEVRSKDNYKRVDSGFLSLNNQDEQYNLLKAQSYHNTGNSDQWRKATWENNIKPAILWTNEERVLWNNINVGDRGRVAVTRFETTVPDNVTNGDLKNMKVMYGEGTHNTTWAGIGIHTNPLGLDNVKAYPFVARDSGTYIVNQVEAPYDTSAFNKAGLKWWYSNKDTKQAYTDPNQYLVHPGTQDYSGTKGPAGTTIEYRIKGTNTKVESNQVGRTPGVFEYNIHRQFPDSKGADTPVKFVVKPKTPEITTTLQDNVSSQTITVENATPNKKVILYKNGVEFASTTANAKGVATFNNVQMANQDSFNAKVKIENQTSYRDNDGRDKDYVESGFSNTVRARFTDTEKPQIAGIVANKGAKVDDTNPRKILVYREEEIDVDIKLTDNLKRLDKIKVRDNGGNATAPSGKFETNDIVDNSKQTAMNFTTNQNRLGQEGSASASQPSVVKLTGHVGKAYTGNSGSWTRYVAGYDRVGLTNDNGTTNDNNDAKITVEYRPQTEKYTPTTTTQNVDIQENGRVRFDNPETYITNRSSLPTNGTTAGAETTYAWVGDEPTNWTAGQHTRNILVTYPDGSTDTVAVNFNVSDRIAPNVTVQGKTLPTTRPTEADAPLFTVYRGATFNPIVKAWDNSGKLTKLQIKNLPGGVTSGSFTEQTGKTESNKYSGRLIDGRVNDNQTLGTHIAEVVVSDGTTETTRYMKYRVVDVVRKNTAANGEVFKNVGDTLGDAHQYIATTGIAAGTEQSDTYFPGGMTFKWNDANRYDVSNEKQLSAPGKWTHNAIAEFPAETKDTSSETRTVFATDKEIQVALVARPTKPAINVDNFGNATVAPKTSESTVNQMTIAYTQKGTNASKTLTATKASNGRWSLNETPAGVSIDPTTGQVSFTDAAVATNTTITSTTRTSDGYSSDPSTARKVAGDTVPPVITANNATATSGEHVDIPLTVVDEGVGLADTDGVVITGLPAGLHYENGKITGAPTSKGTSTVKIVAKDKRGNTSTQTITIAVQSQADKYNVTTKNNGNFYAIKDEDVANLTPRDFVNGTIPETAKVIWKTAPTTGEVGSGKAAVVTITYPDGSTKDLNYTYQVYPKLETKTNNNQTGNFHSFKTFNKIGGDTYVYTNLANRQGFDGLPVKWKYDYRLNNEGDNITTPVGNDYFSRVWNVDNMAHKTDYKLTAIYPNGRFGAVTADNPALESSTTWHYSVYDYGAKQVFETSQGDLAGLGSMVTDPKDAVVPKDGRTEAPDATKYTWHQGEQPNDSTVANPGFSIHRVNMELPPDSSTVIHKLSDKANFEIPVVVKVNPKTPVIVENTISEKGGLPNQSIKIDNVVGGAKVTLTIGDKTFTKTAGPNDTSVTFSPTELKEAYDANNGLLPTGNVTVKQEVTRRDPSDNTDKVLTSATATGTITRETVAPVAQDTVVEVKQKDGSWVPVPKTTDANGLTTHTFYAGDELRFTTKFTDNSDKIANTVVRQGSNTASETDNVLHSTWGTVAPNNITTVTPATATSPATVIQTGTVNANLQYGDGQHVTRAIVAEDTVGNRSEGSRFRLKQGKLSEKHPGVDPKTKFEVADVNNLTAEEKAKVFEAIKASNPKADKQIDSYTQNDDGSVTITYLDGTSNLVRPNVKYAVEKVSDRFYAVQNENVNDLNLRTFVRGIGGKNLPEGTKVTWETAPTFNEIGNRTAYLKVEHPDGTVTPHIEYNYTVLKKLETFTRDGKTGKFYAFKADSGTDRVTGGNWANNIGGFSNLYVNNDRLNDSNALGSYSLSSLTFKYKLNNDENAIQTEKVNTTFSNVWHTTKVSDADNQPLAHNTTYTAVANYSRGRFGNASNGDPALTSTVTFDYSVVDPVAKKVYETTVGDKGPLADIINTPGNAIKNTDIVLTTNPTDGTATAVSSTEANSATAASGTTTTQTVPMPDGVDFAWDGTTALDADTIVAAPGYYTRNVRVTLPKSTTEGDKPRNSRTVPVTIKVNLKTPKIADDQVTNTGGLPNRSITVTDVAPGATVTLTIGDKTFPPKVVPAGATSVTFGADELADANGLLPKGTVTATQTKDIATPTGETETLSTSTTKEITKETEAPKVTVKVEVFDKSTNTWVEAPKTTDGKSKIYAGDKFRVTVTTTDNSGKVKNIEAWNNSVNEDPKYATTNLIPSPYAEKGLAIQTTNTVTNASVAQPDTRQLTEEGTYNPTQPYSAGNKWTRFARVRDLSDNTNFVEYGLQQAPLNEKYEPKVPASIKVTNKTNPTAEDREKIRAEIEKLNAGKQIKSISVNERGLVTVTYDDNTVDTVTPTLDDSDYKSQKASESASTSASESASTSASQSASTSASQSASTSASQSASTSASQSASTSASQSASTSASQSASTSASQSASTSASQSASTSASQSASTSASESASTSASASASTSASESASTSASQSASTSASQSASTSASQSASTSASQSASTSASQSASTSASQSASTSASQSASTSASQSASTSASESASTSASESASTSASQSASTSASESASTSASESASTSASESASTSASESASTSASESASTSASESASTSASESASTSASESASTSASQSASTSASESASTSASASASTSASESASTSASESASTSASESASTSASESASTSASESASTSASESASTSASESASTSASESASTSASESASTSASESASTSASESASTSASESASTSASESASTSASESASTSASESASTSASESASTSASESASTSASESASTSASESASTSASESASTSASESASTSASESASTSASESASTSASESASTSASESASTSASESASTSASASASTSASESASTSASESASTSASESASTSASESASTSASESASTSASQSASTSASESASTSASESASTSASESASTSASASASTSASESASTSASESASTSASESASTSASESASTSASESASTSASESASTSASESASTSASESASTSASESASTSASESASTSASESASTSASESASTSASESASTSASESASTSASESASTSASESASTSASESASTSASESAST